MDDAVEAGLGKSKFIYEELIKSKQDRTLKMAQVRLNETQENPMELWKSKQN